MFIMNKYYKWYNKIIDKASSRTSLIIKEKHHIIPRSLGGDNSKSNLVNLTPKEHYVCHLLLTKFTVGDAKRKMSYALHRLTNTPNQRIKSSIIYNIIRTSHALMLSEKYTGMSIQDRFGKPYSHEISSYQKQRIAESNSLRVWTEESKKKLSDSQKLRRINNPASFNVGKSKTSQHKENMSISKINKFKNADTIIYQWNHSIYGVFTGTRSSLRDNFPEQKLKVSELSKLINPLYPEKSYKGWSVKLF